VRRRTSKPFSSARPLRLWLLGRQLYPVHLPVSNNLRLRRWSRTVSAKDTGQFMICVLCVYICIYIQMYVYVLCLYVYIYICMCVCACVCACACACACVCACVCVCVCVCACDGMLVYIVRSHAPHDVWLGMSIQHSIFPLLALADWIVHVSNAIHGEILWAVRVPKRVRVRNSRRRARRQLSHLPINQNRTRDTRKLDRDWGCCVINPPNVKLRIPGFYPIWECLPARQKVAERQHPGPHPLPDLALDSLDGRGVDGAKVGRHPLGVPELSIQEIRIWKGKSG
jgi:hypothetical protein